MVPLAYSMGRLSVMATMPTLKFTRNEYTLKKPKKAISTTM